MSAWNVSILAAFALMAAGALYVHLRWQRSPQAWRAMVGLAVTYFLAGVVTGGWVVHLIAGRTGQAEQGGGQGLVGRATAAAVAPPLHKDSTVLNSAAPPLQYDIAHAVLPDPKLTPGDILPAVTAADVCTPGWASEHRHVTESMRAQVYAKYGYNYDYCEGPKRGVPYESCDVDHLIPLELGGNNSLSNLWPEPNSCADRQNCAVYDPRPGAAEKDQLENELHHLVCASKMSLAEAQKCIASNWIECWEKHVVPGYGAEWASENRHGW